MSTSDPMVESVLAMLEGNGLDYEVAENDDADGPLLRVVHEGTSARWVVYLHVAAGERYLAVYSVFPFDTPPDARDAAADLLSRINSGLVIGNFEIDLDDGEILAKTSMSVVDDHVSPEAVARLLDANLEAMDRYFPAIAEVVLGRMSPTEAMTLVE